MRSRFPLINSTGFGFAADFRAVSSPTTTISAWNGGGTLSGLIWSGTFRNSAPGYPPKPCGVSGPCWRITNRKGSTPLSLASGLGVDGKTTASYLDLLVDLLLVRRLPAWHRNVGKRLVKSPKVYVRDSGIVHALLGIRDKETLLGHPVAGPSWESFVTETLIAAAPDGTEAHYYRTCHRDRN